MSNKNRKCSGSKCPMQHSTMNVGECKCTDTCEWYTPVSDFSGMEAVIDMAIKQFGLESDADKQKIRILFNAFVGQYISACFPLGGRQP